ncbi:hypothetical protein [Nannocystis punicea]|uniref:Uncharacterized protein n=1 Tax=Nannocystis punicea TaxID=2995304 RepID=A0ABY7HD51_9BACT|nr:hypothetical protein [Nannocystis poenicansa]WAS97223.1 hypothetical protein O0S08_13835 [Nannocystis poenicansa]
MSRPLDFLDTRPSGVSVASARIATELTPDMCFSLDGAVAGSTPTVKSGAVPTQVDSSFAAPDAMG